MVVANPSPPSSKSRGGLINLTPKKQKHSDFSEEYMGSEVSVVLYNGHSIVGRVAEARRFWFKIIASDGKVYYVNKAWVVCVEPKR